uniref:Cap-specific mRNA (nucleoside-2'-O-)-methyltransferase 2 n=1 Tax=Caenorhabditis japonica TaxID=281687 RepID=A0A8R1HND4_CAEJA
MLSPPIEDDVPENPIKWMTEDEMVEYYNYCTEEVDKITRRCGVDVWDKCTDLLHDNFRNPRVLQNYYVCRNRAFLKLCEIFDQFQLTGTTKSVGREFRTFHLCEGPGYFIDATYAAWQKSGLATSGTWYWAANTLHPYFENISCFDKLIDDSHIRGKEDRWFFGPDGDGDVRKLNEEYLIENHLAGTFDLVTADGSTNTQGDEHRLESIVYPILEAEVRAALKLLRTGGRFILKCYRFCHEDTRDLLGLLADNFATVRAFKPMSSRQGSSEKYLICDGFGRKCTIPTWKMVNCDEQFLRKQYDRIRHHIDSFRTGERKYSIEQKRDFIKSMRSKMFNNLNSKIRDNLAKMFKIRQGTSPWIHVYGTNLIRRGGPENLPNAIENFVNTASCVGTSTQDFDVEWIVESIMEQKEPLLQISTVPLKTVDSLFIEPVAFLALRHYYRNQYLDLFETVDQVKSARDQNWREFLHQTPEGLVLHLEPTITLENILMACLETFDQIDHLQKATSFSFSFRLRQADESKLPMLLSRLSCSIFVLMQCLFKQMRINGSSVTFEVPRRIIKVRDMIVHILTAIGRLPDHTSIRCFIPNQLLDAFHPQLSYHNLALLSTLCKQLIFFIVHSRKMQVRSTEISTS